MLSRTSWTVVGLVAALVASFAAFAASAGETPKQAVAPVAPTVPLPNAPGGHIVRFQNLVGASAATQKEKPNPIRMVETGPEMTLGECIAIAVENSPNLKAVRASMTATEAGSRSIQNFGSVGTLISPDLDIRKQQAQRGLTGTAGEYQRVHNEVVQDCTRMYYTAVYAGQQQAIADQVVEDLKELIDLMDMLIKTAKTPDELGGLNTAKLLAAKLGLKKAQPLQSTATIGRKQAMAALRQVMAVDNTFAFRVKDKELPLMTQNAEITRDRVVEMAVCRRPELALAAAAVDIFRLEVYAQGKIPFKRVVPTFASGADLHSKDIPPAMRGKEYRPGAISPEMPTQLVGSKYDRVSRAMAFSQKADAVYESAKGLIVLEAENAFFEFELAGEKLRYAKESLDLAVELLKLTRKNAPNNKADQIIEAEILTAKTKSEYVESVLQYLLSLSALERITAGGIAPAFPGR